MNVGDGLDWTHVFWISGSAPKDAEHRNEILDPPCNGWQHAFMMRGEKRTVIFCPYSMQSHQVTNQSLEVLGAKEPAKFRRDFVVDLMLSKWAEHQRLGMSADYDTAAMVLKKLGAEVPTIIITKDGTEDTRSRGGKSAEDRLLKPVKRDGKRGVFLAWFQEGGNTRSVREAMAHFDMTRSNVLSYLHQLNKDHGLGYDLVGDAATIILPDGCEDPFAMRVEVSDSKEADDDSWLDG